MDLLATSNSMLMMEKSMAYLWTKQAAILDNISNVETPNYKAKVVTFEESLRDQLEHAANFTADAKRSVRKVLDKHDDFFVFEAQEVTRMDDNGINITEQASELIRNTYQIQYIMQSISSDLSILRTAVRGQ